MKGPWYRAILSCSTENRFVTVIGVRKPQIWLAVHRQNACID
jgi:hypothetical protein